MIMMMMSMYQENSAKSEKEWNLPETERKLKEEKLDNRMKIAALLLSSMVEIDTLPEASSSK